MKHFGDITKLSGYDLPVVDIITGGSPCQDLSVAGKRAGLAGERSGLFMEQVRIVKEMRERDARDTGRTGWAVRPRYMVWENVPGAFSSNGGKDFQAVLEEIVRIVEDEAPDLSTVVQGGWTKSGCLYDEMGAWSVAWRVHDAQFWGVPQRRKRIALVADFGGLSAPEILFERKGLRGNLAESGTAGQGTASAAEIGAGSAEPVLLESNQNHATIQTDGVSTALPASMGMGGGYVPMVAGSAISFQERAGKPGGGKGILIQGEHVGALTTLNNQSALCLNDQGGSMMDVSDKAATLRSQSHGHEPAVFCGVDVYNQELTGEVAASLTAASGGANTSGPKVFSLQGNTIDRDVQQGGAGVNEDVAFTLNAVARHGVAYGFKAGQSKAGGIGWAEEKAATLSAYCSGTEPTVYDARGNGDGRLSPTITGDHQNRVTDYTALAVGNGQLNQISMAEQANTLDTMHDQQAVITFDKEMYNCGENSQASPQARPDTVAPTVRADDHPSGVCTSTVRRLTPLECERLQGFPDGWTDIGEWTDSKGKKHKEADSPRYKALGNSIALPFWCWLARRICAQYERQITMASLFDGIGGFPLAFQTAGAVPVWASEIEEFPIAVTKIRFPEEGDDA